MGDRSSLSAKCDGVHRLLFALARQTATKLYAQPPLIARRAFVEDGLNGVTDGGAETGRGLTTRSRGESGC